MVRLPCVITLMVYRRVLHAEDGVCYTEYDMQEACYDCCYGTQLSTYNNVTSAVACSVLCSSNEQCRSLHYNPIKKECWTNGEKMTTVNTSCTNLIRYGEIKMGSCHTHRMFEPCTRDADCPIANSTCRNGKCECKNGHPYDYRFDSCPTECTKYGNTFHVVPYYLLYTYSSRYDGVSADECIQKCLTATDFLCRFIEYEEWPTRICHLSEFNALTAVSKAAYVDGWWQWDRNCA